MTCLRNDQVVETVMKEIFKHTKPGSIIIDNSTTNYELAENLYQQAKKQKIDFLDAPVTGAEKGAERGDLATSVGGNNTAFNQVKGIIKNRT